MSRVHTDLVDGYLALQLRNNFVVSKHVAWMVSCWYVNRHQSQGSEFKGGILPAGNRMQPSVLVIKICAIHYILQTTHLL